MHRLCARRRSLKPTRCSPSASPGEAGSICSHESDFKPIVTSIFSSPYCHTFFMTAPGGLIREASSQPNLKDRGVNWDRGLRSTGVENTQANLPQLVRGTAAAQLVLSPAPEDPGRWSALLGQDVVQRVLGVRVGWCEMWGKMALCFFPWFSILPLERTGLSVPCPQVSLISPAYPGCRQAY